MMRYDKDGKITEDYCEFTAFSEVRNITIENGTFIQGPRIFWDACLVHGGDITLDNVIIEETPYIHDDEDWDNDGGNALVPEARRIAYPEDWR